jgi:AraC family transcriptional regulator
VNIQSPWPAFDDFVADLSVRSGLNDGVMQGSAVGLYRGIANDGPKSASDQHILAMCFRVPARFERAGACNNWISYVKSPGTLSLVPAGAHGFIRAQSDFEVLACALDSTLVNGIDAELDHRPTGELRLRVNFQDSATQQLMKLLLADFADGSPAGRFYTDHLIHALAYRFVILAREAAPSAAARGISPLPKHILRRVVDRMKSSDSKLSLQTIAQESGYSRVHFMRMFRAATGRNPHNYLLNIRMERARDLLANPALSLTEIALDCGFSSHSHMTRAFRQFLGVTPSEYRRGL